MRQWCYYEEVLLARLRLSQALYNHRIKRVTHGRLLDVTIDNKLSRTQYFWSEETFFFQQIKSHWPEISGIIISYFTFFNLKYSAQKSTPNLPFLYGETSRWTFMDGWIISCMLSSIVISPQENNASKLLDLTHISWKIQ